MAEPPRYRDFFARSSRNTVASKAATAFAWKSLVCVGALGIFWHYFIGPTQDFLLKHFGVLEAEELRSSTWDKENARAVLKFGDLRKASGKVASDLILGEATN